MPLDWILAVVEYVAAAVVKVAAGMLAATTAAFVIELLFSIAAVVVGVLPPHLVGAAAVIRFCGVVDVSTPVKVLTAFVDGAVVSHVVVGAIAAVLFAAFVEEAAGVDAVEAMTAIGECSEVAVLAVVFFLPVDRAFWLQQPVVVMVSVLH